MDLGNWKLITCGGSGVYIIFQYSFSNNKEHYGWNINIINNFVLLCFCFVFYTFKNRNYTDPNGKHNHDMVNDIIINDTTRLVIFHAYFVLHVT